MPDPAKFTPVFKQWYEAKQQYPDVLLLFRMGDFYEMFGEDAEIAARELELTLTRRKAGAMSYLPMCGVPYHAVERYLAELIRKGYRAAICEQVEDPRKARGLVKRAVTRVVTAGTLLEDELLDRSDHNFLLSIALCDGRYGLAVVDISTGDFLVTEPAPVHDETPAAPELPATGVEHIDPQVAAVVDEATRLAPTEILLSPDITGDTRLHELLQANLNVPVSVPEGSDSYFRSAEDELKDHFGVESLRGYGCEDMPAAVEAAAQALRYLKHTHLEGMPHLTGITTYSTQDFLIIDAATRRNLELTQTIRDARRDGSLLALLDRTRTAMGGRLLRSWLLQPLLDVAAVNRRLDAVDELVGDRIMAEELAEQLREVYDIERLTSRASAGRANARDLVALRDSLRRLPAIIETLGRAKSELLAEVRDGVDTLDELKQLLEAALADDPPVLLTEGGLIRPGYSDELDELRDIAGGGKKWIAQLEASERARTGIEKLKVGYNKVFGYYIEVTHANSHLVPEDYERKQTLVNAERYITPELKEQEAKILGAEERMQDLEYELFCGVRDRVAEHADALMDTAAALATLDVIGCLAEVAIEYDYVRPEVDTSGVIEISGGRHPVVERAGSGEPFVPNDTLLDHDGHQMLIVTGPNMSGKSTYLRQVALITLMAQMGSFVPARSAHIGVVDRIFTRVGASDDLATGRSTFMVEMNETANIMNNATERSLVILDEIGRGTSTFDGVSIAWAVAEHLVTAIGAKTLFATHYHHLNELEQLFDQVQNLKVMVREEGDHIVFLRRIEPGGTQRSYGIQVARLAGLPSEVVERAREVLHTLEREDLGTQVGPTQDAASRVAPTVQLQLFEAAPHPVLERLKDLDIEGMTPLEALQLLAELKRKAEE
ncbi:MAG: DNA mismatch repair protein MutS [Armatimonadetes bacterium]|nr:DNA mismatch repair protein MutS [Armatimonadota bacterium]